MYVPLACTTFAGVMDILLIIIGAVLVLWGADRLTEGASALARRMNIPQIVIGLTVVAMGTSMPEFFVSLMSALKGTSDLAVGNIVGSNTFNSLMIVGMSAAIAPMVISKSTVKKDIPFAVAASLTLTLMCLDGGISRADSIVLIVFFIVFMAYTLRLARHGKADVEPARPKQVSPWLAAFYVFLGLTCLVYGSNLFVSSATAIARALNVSDAVIGLTIVAGGTSLPELATSMVAALKGRSAIAIGNVIGSNVFNILMILGITGLITPMQIQGIQLLDLLVMIFSMVLVWLFSFTRYTIARWEGILAVILFVGYIAWLVYNV